MIKKCQVERKTAEEWQELVDGFDPRKQSKIAYCTDKNIKYGSFKHWFYKLKPLAGSKDSAIPAKSVGSSFTAFADSSSAAKEANADTNAINKTINKEFVGFKLLANITTIKLPNGISLEVGSGDIIGLIKQLMRVA